MNNIASITVVFEDGSIFTLPAPVTAAVVPEVAAPVENAEATPDVQGEGSPDVRDGSTL